MERSEGERSTRLPGSLYGFAWVLAGLMAVCVLLNLYWARVGGQEMYPYATPFLDRYFPDFVDFMPRFRHFGTREFFTSPWSSPFMYPAPLAVVCEGFYLVPGHPLLAFLLVGLVGAALACWLLGRMLVRRGIGRREAYGFPIVVLLCTYPAWFAGKQANMEIVIWLLMTAGLVFFLRRQGYAAAVCFGMVAAMKIYPVVALGLLVQRRQYRQIAAGLATLVLATVGSLAMVSPGVGESWRRINAGLAQFRELYMLPTRVELGLDHSLFATVKRLLHPYPAPEPMGHLLSIYLVAVAVGGVVLFFLRIRRLPVLNQIFCLTIASVLLPPVSYEYTLLQLFVPFGLYVLLLVECRREGGRAPGEWFVLGCFVVLFGFLPDLIHHGTQFGGVIKSLALLALFGFALGRQMVAPAEALQAGG